MAGCRACGAPIDWAQRVDTGERLPLDTGPTYRGEHRYRVVDWGVPMGVEPVDPTADVQGHLDHRVSCPMNGGR